MRSTSLPCATRLERTCTSIARPVRVTQGRRVLLVKAAAESSDGFFSSIKAIAKKVQGALPIVGLVSRLATPEGGFDELAYPEFCRYMIDNSPVSYRIAAAELEKMYGKPASSRYVLLVLWMSKVGVGLVPSKDIVSAGRRLRITQDIEIEMERFEQTKSTTLAKFDMIQRPEGKLADKLAVAVDAVATLVVGVKEGEPVPAAAAPLVRDMVAGTFPEAAPEAVEAAVAGRAGRSY